MSRNNVYFVTSNDYKFDEVKSILGDVVFLKRLSFDFVEIQSKSIISLLHNKISQVISHYSNKCLIVEDSGIIINSLSLNYPFPGIYSKHIYEAIGLKGILNLLRDIKDRRAQMYSYVAYYDKENIFIFKGIIDGEISFNIRGEKGFAYDFIFIPKNRKKTFAEDYEFKKIYSHRSLSFKKLKEFLISKYVKD